MHKQLLYDRLTAKRRIGERKEAAYGDRAGEIATELAMHFERGGEYPKAVRYLQQAAKHALPRRTREEAILHLTKRLELLKALPNMPERSQRAVLLQISLDQIAGASRLGI